MTTRDKLIELLQNSDAVKYEPNAYRTDRLSANGLDEKMSFFVCADNGNLSIDYGKFADTLIKSGLIVDDTIYKVDKTTVGKEWCYECPKCEFLFSYAGNYCPNCGCKLKE